MGREVAELFNEYPFNPTGLHKIIENINAADIAEAFESSEKERIIQIYRLLPKNMAAEVFSFMEPDVQEIVVEALTDDEIGRIVEELFVDDAVDFIEEMPSNVVKRVLRNVSEDRRNIINLLLQYPEDSAGSIMTTEFVDLKEGASVKDAFEKIRATGVDKETIYTCYVVRSDRVLAGVVSVRTLLLANPADRIGDIMDASVVFANTTDDQEAVADMFRKYGLLSMPVVDKEQRLVGIVTVDDIIEIIEEENTEDIERMAALTPSEEPYLKTGIIVLSRNRIMWLLVLMFSATITGFIISSFEDVLVALPALFAFVPMLMDTGGNAGSQVSALMIRGMALGEIKFEDIIKVVWREIRVGLLCGCALGIINFFRVYLFSDGRDALLSITVTVSLIVTVVMAKTVGCVLPLVAKKCRIDPTVMAAPLITSIVDAAALVFYFYIAKLLMGI